MKVKAKPKQAPTPPLPQGAEELMDPGQIAAALRVKRTTFHAMRSMGKYPKPDVMLSDRLPRWRVGTHNAWIQQQGSK